MSSSPLFDRVLLSNDDGIDAPGFKVLEEVAATLAREVWVVAPAHDRSGVARAISLHDPLRLMERGPRRYAVAGTPSDCVVLALQHLLRDAPPDLVIAGVNRGANVGQEVTMSGTVSAAMMARTLGFRGIAVSQAFRDRNNVRWDTARHGITAFFRWMDERGGIPEGVLNVNFPDVDVSELTGIEITRQGPGAMLSIEVASREDMRGYDYHWLSFRREPRPQPEDSDYGALRRQAISVTPLGHDLTDYAAVERLRKQVAR